MKKVIFSFLFIISQLIFAQAPNWEWARKSVGNSFDDSIKTTCDNDGNVISSGFFVSPTITFGSFTLSNDDYRDGFITKYNSTGDVLWAKKIGGIREQIVFSVCCDSQNNIYASGNFSSPTLTIENLTVTNSDFTNTSPQNDAFIAKFDSNGNIIWLKSGGGYGSDYGKSISIDNQDNVFLGGIFSSESFFFDGLLTNNTGSINNFYHHDVFLIKINPNGNSTWIKRFGGINYDNLTCLATDDIGNIYVAGYFMSQSFNAGIILTNTSTSFEFFIIKLNSLGQLIWAKKSIGTDNEVLSDIKIDNLNNVYVTGDFNSPIMTLGNISINKSISTNDNSSFNNNIFLAKYNADGQIQWVKSAGGVTAFDGASGLDIDNSNNIYIVGRMYSDTVMFDSLPQLNNNGNADIFVTKYNSNGDAIWAKNTGSSSYDRADSVSIFENSLYVNGVVSALATVNFDGTIFNQSSNQSGVFLAKLNLQNLNSNNFYQKKYSISPNPVKNIVTVKSNGTSNSSYSLTDMNGRELLSGKLSLETTDIDVSHLQKGIYIITYDHKESLKLIKE